MRVIAVSQPGGPEVLRPARRDVPNPGPEEVLARVRAFGLNRADLLQRRGLYPPPPGAPPDVLGLEFAGHVSALGVGVSSVRPGDAVMGVVAGGAYAEYVVTRADHLLPVPAGMSIVDAAAIPEAFLTAYDALERLGVVRDEWTLVHAIASGVGTAASQLIALRGARCIGTSRSAEKLRRVAELGVTVAIDMTREDFVQRVRAITEDGVQAAIDLVGGVGFARTLEALAPRGRVIVVGLTAGRTCELDLGLLLRHRLHIQGTVLRVRSALEKAALTAAFASDVLPHFASGVIRPVIDRVFDYRDIVAAHEYMEGNNNVGKIIVRFEGTTA